jgi:hydroxyacylglutathione hydrolase
MPSIIAIPAFKDNYIWMIRDGARAAAVDPGDAAPVQAWLAREGVTLAAILNTHHHADHVGGNRALLMHTPVPVFGPARETIPGCDHPLREGDVVALPGMAATFNVLDVPGHTAGHIAYVGDMGDGAALFCGDTLFAGGCGRLFEGTPADMHASLMKLAALAPATRVYCAHEYTLANLAFAAAVEPANPALALRTMNAQTQRAAGVPTVPSTLAIERATNPFLRASEPAVRASAERQAGRALASPVEVFAAVRAWKDGFRG